ncbi:efflux RND transporter periplasmic adaptor subunit [Vacuolonema iberomarrocanum]|uniref:efflux RND transporter periplasmic adaptor subunit n=1 Tax=Vacuolonema iberomarrocanum TaxID=3454632 RepID=UPI003F6E2FC1
MGLYRAGLLVLLGIVMPLAASCGGMSRPAAQAQSSPPVEAGEEIVAVETAIAQTAAIKTDRELTGTTEPIRQVSLRSQTEGQLVSLAVDVGDRVNQGQSLGQIDDRLLTTQVQQAEAELASRRSAVAEAQAEVSDVQAQVAQLQVQLQQAIADADRLQNLADEGAVTTQQAEQAQTARLAAEQAVRSTEERVRTRQQAVAAAQAQVTAQQATLAEIQQRRAFSALNAPIGGAVLERLRQPGDLVRLGEEILTLGDFRTIKVVVPVSELELALVQVGQSVPVRLDAFPDRTFTGRVERIAPVADTVARLVPVEILLPNNEGLITAGLLARASFQASPNQVIVPERALDLGSGEEPVMFVLQQAGETVTVHQRSVEVGDRAQSEVEILNGIEPGETIIVRSSGPLTDGQTVRLSLLSETNE